MFRYCENVHFFNPFSKPWGGVQRNWYRYRVSKARHQGFLFHSKKKKTVTGWVEELLIGGVASCDENTRRREREKKMWGKRQRQRQRQKCLNKMTTPNTETLTIVLKEWQSGLKGSIAPLWQQHTKQPNDLDNQGQTWWIQMDLFLCGDENKARQKS